MTRAIFIAATGQNIGKTTICLGLIAALRKRFSKIGFIKPIGQQHVNVGPNLNVDKDVVLFKEHFGLEHEYLDMSPVILPAGFTRDFLDKRVDEKVIEDKIKSSFAKIKRDSEFTVVEGTGHTGVGSIIHMNNAKVASLLGLDIVMIASGGLGSTYDELSLNFALCRQYGVNICGVILNRVLNDKRAMLENYFPKALQEWNIPLIGCLPYNEFLSNPTLKDFEILFKTELLAGEEYHYRHFPHIRLIAGSIKAYKQERMPGELIITPACREDIILASLHYYAHSDQNQKQGLIDGFILTGNEPPSSKIVSKLKEARMPALYAPVCSYDAMKMITSFTAKIRGEDYPKVQEAIYLVEKYLNLDLLIEKMGDV